jgi:FixJ family two-component response regulator
MSSPLADRPLLAASAPAVPRPETVRPEPVRPEPACIAVVDDDAAARMSMVRLLEVSGYAPHPFANGMALLDDGAPARFACILMDLQMPGLSGTDTQRALLLRGVSTPMIFLTAFGTVPATVRAMQAGAIDFLEKPADPSVLLAGVARAVATAGDRGARHQQRDTMRQRAALMTTREREVFEQVVRGLPNKQIGAVLGIALKTVKVHRGRVMQKMEAGSVADLVRAAEMLADDAP